MFYSAGPVTRYSRLNKISDWLATNRLSLNVSKSNVVLFNSSRKKTKIKIELKINNEIISEKEFTKYLGIFIDNKISWPQHIHHVNLKISKGIGILCKLRHLVSRHMLHSLYFTFIQPHIDYGLVNWGCASSTNLEATRKNIKKVIRIISFQNKDSHTQPLFEKLKSFDFDKFYEFIIGKFMWKLSDSMLPDSINLLFSKCNKDISGHENDYVYLP